MAGALLSMYLGTKAELLPCVQPLALVIHTIRTREVHHITGSSILLFVNGFSGRWQTVA
jgi:hypothetical protein